jgi:hypothetical protein
MERKNIYTRQAVMGWATRKKKDKIEDSAITLSPSVEM